MTLSPRCGQAGGGPPHACGSARSALGPHRPTFMAKLVAHGESLVCVRGRCALLRGGGGVLLCRCCVPVVRTDCPSGCV